MCGRFQIDTNKEDIEKHYGMKLSASFKPRYNISPSQQIPVVLDDKIELMEWGLPLKFGEKVVRTLINVRDDSLGKGWAKRYLLQRCLIPATGYYEWKKTADGKVPYFFKPEKEKLFSFAGLYEDGKFGIITTAANKQAEEVHNRMPAILSREEEKRWMNADYSELEELTPLIHLYQHKMEEYPISTLVNNPRNDTTSITKRVINI
jgi:putative SOS response-associated peptidase YedK